jgi:hypothetical protein
MECVLCHLSFVLHKRALERRQKKGQSIAAPAFSLV